MNNFSDKIVYMLEKNGRYCDVPPNQTALSWMTAESIGAISTDRLVSPAAVRNRKSITVGALRRPDLSVVDLRSTSYLYDGRRISHGSRLDSNRNLIGPI